MTYTSSCEVRKAKPHLQQVQQKSFYHYTSSGSYLWTSQRAADTIYSNFSKAFHTVFHDILVPKFGHDSLDRQTARWVKITGWMVQLRGQRSTPQTVLVIGGSTTEVWTCPFDKHVAQIGDTVSDLEMAPNWASVNDRQGRATAQRSRLVGGMACQELMKLNKAKSKVLLAGRTNILLPVWHLC